jgi:hypothetical protein
MTWQRVVSVVVLLAVLAGFTIAIFTNSSNIKSAQVQSCLGGGFARSQQLLFDWAVYRADVKSAAAYVKESQTAKANKNLIQRQGDIRGTEAQQLFVAMAKIAATRIDVRWAILLPRRLRHIVVSNQFYCSAHN